MQKQIFEPIPPLSQLRERLVGLREQALALPPSIIERGKILGHIRCALKGDSAAGAQYQAGLIEKELTRVQQALSEFMAVKGDGKFEEIMRANDSPVTAASGNERMKKGSASGYKHGGKQGSL